MKRQTIFIFVFCSLPFLTRATGGRITSGYDTTIVDHFFYTSWCVSGGGFFYTAPQGQLQVSIPYTITGNAGNTSKNIFVSNPINSYPANGGLFGLSFEAGGLWPFFALHFSWSAIADGRDNDYVGGGCNIYFDLPKVKHRKPAERYFVFKPSLYLNWSGFHTEYTVPQERNYLGYINNENSTISFSGYASGPTFVYSPPKQSSNTENTSSVDFYYVQHNFALVPTLTLSNNQFKQVYRWDVSLAYVIPIGQTGGIQAYQNNMNPMNAGNNLIPLNGNGITSTFNGKTISKAPFLFYGWQISADIDFNLSFKPGQKIIRRKRGSSTSGNTAR